jgi:hypothetical protein
MSQEEMSQWDKHELLRTLLREQPELANAYIARRTGYSPTWVASVRRDIAREPERLRRMRLTRAAPDLLYALEDLLAAVAEHDGPKSQEELGVIGRAMTAIKKAKGEE